MPRMGDLGQGECLRSDLVYCISFRGQLFCEIVSFLH